MLLSLLVLSVPVLSLPPHQRDAIYRSLPADVGAAVAGNIKLIFVNAVTFILYPLNYLSARVSVDAHYWHHSSLEKWSPLENRLCFTSI